ncbi:MAG TPA: ThuA domain-containing protein [Tepidisphaeraceae bacterium]|jgi:type 1 glutamine amidotransferase|nr:ThuA domain-containing protein [Tepidisphaeraceae bacterium]
MCRFSLGLAFSCIATLLFSTSAHAAEPQFQKIRLTDSFLSEGATFADFNHDGHTDVASGPYWYEGPDFTKRHEFMPVHHWNPAHEYSDAFLMYTGDFNHDGAPDILVVGFPTRDARWYENPKNNNADSHWVEHPIVDNHLDDECPLLIDLFKNGTPCLVSPVNGPLGYLTPDPADANKPWIFHPVSGNRHYGPFTHGLGVGDINGDGRLDILVHNGWYEQPEKLDDAKPWTFHPVDFNTGGAQMLVYDVDGDGKNDVITSLQAHGFGIAWFKQLADGKFEQHLITNTLSEKGTNDILFSQPHSLALADVDGDGLMDFVSGKRRFAHGDHGDPDPLADPVLYWFQLVRTPGEEPKFVAHLVDKQTGVGTQVTAADLNNDGKTDILVGNKTGTTVFLQTAAGASAAAVSTAPLFPDPYIARKVLVFSMTKAFHHDSIPAGHKMMTELGERSKEFTAVVSDDLSNFDPDKITQFSAICFLSTTGEIPFTDEQKKAILDNISSGKIGFVGIHSATDTLYNWPEYNKLIGAYFDGHPWNANTTVTLRREVDNPITAPFPPEFKLTEELYQMKDYDRANCDVLISLDPSKNDMTLPGMHRTDNDFPVSWIKTYGEKGRVFYTSLGHNDAIYERHDYEDHILAGLKWVLRDYDLDVKSHPLPASK